MCDFYLDNLIPFFRAVVSGPAVLVLAGLLFSHLEFC